MFVSTVDSAMLGTRFLPFLSLFISSTLMRQRKDRYGNMLFSEDDSTKVKESTLLIQLMSIL